MGLQLWHYKNEKGNVPVQLTIEGEHEDLKKVVNRFEELGFSIIEMDGVVKKEKITTIFFGHIVDQDLRDTMDRINALDGVVIVAFDIKLNGEEKSTALINIEADVGKKQAVFNRIAEIAEEKDLLVINEV